MTSASAIEISDLVDNRPIDRWLIGLTVLCVLVLAFDGYDTQAIGYIAPALVQEFNTAKGSLGPVFSAGLFGLLLGSLICGPAADRFGQRLVMIVATGWFAICAGATASFPGSSFCSTASHWARAWGSVTKRRRSGRGIHAQAPPRQDDHYHRRAAPRRIACRPTLVDRHRVRVGSDPIGLRFDCHTGDGLDLGHTPSPEPVALTD